jgi:hypothetical protein
LTADPAHFFGFYLLMEEKTMDAIIKQLRRPAWGRAGLYWEWSKQ